jgi:hypothetical protein
VAVGDERFEAAIAAIDAANADDPVRIVVGGVERPKELAHAELATQWVRALRPDPSEALLLAARGHHVRRFDVPRATYPDGRAGYLRWRRDLHGHHAEVLAGLLGPLGYDEVTVQRVQAIVRKVGLRDDPEVQALEDALCLVFLETQLRSVRERLDDGKLVDVLAKTARKMSPAGLAAARTLPLDGDSRSLLDAALARAGAAVEDPRP